MWKARQLKDYRRQNGLCYSCGEKFSPGHVCTSKQNAQAKAIEAAEQQVQLSDPVLNAIAVEEVAEEATAYLSVNALSGTTNTKSIRLRALVGNQVMLLLLDSGSSHTFIDQQLADKLKYKAQDLPTPLIVKVANGEQLQCTQHIQGLEWWIQGHTFTTDMKVLAMGGYDAILGMDWLSQWGPMVCHWQDQWIQFQRGDKTIMLQGLQTPPVTELQELSMEQVVKCQKGNDIWATAVLSRMAVVETSVVPECIQNTIKTFEDVFQEPKGLPPHREFDHAISLLPNSVPVNSRPYRYSPLQKDEIERQVAEMIQAGIVKPSMSPYASPVLLVKKKDGMWRFCVDYRRLNSVTVKSKFPLPVVDELLDELAGAKWFSKLDLRSSYHQIRMVESDEEKTAFKTHQGQYQFRVMPFGLTNAPATFQCLMNATFARFIRKFVLVFMDDILIFSEDLEQHQHHLQEVLSVLREHQLFAELSKCSFAQQELEYLGHIISDKGVSTDPAKTTAMVQWPRPTTVTELRGFLGLTG